MEYRVLARKYRPATFDDLIGQDVLVRTLANAIATGRIAHGFLLTGIRGIGKTTTARIIARALNCIGADGQGGPTIAPCGVCSNCKAIAEGNHVDVLEMDAASHTGVGDIRELIDSVRYLPSSARYKIYIVDEVHMLSNSAFNALLKTLEEPPPHVKFIFATTEARKIPVTILSRCQRFDLKRLTTEMLAQHIVTIASREAVQIEPEAATLIAVAAEGSVRDALSLLDQAIARDSTVTAASVRQMIGGADNEATFRLLEHALRGDAPAAMQEARSQYAAGIDPLLMVQDALDVVHLITRVKLAPQAANDVTLSESDRTHAVDMAKSLSMPVLTRLWQMLLKGVSELRHAPVPLHALEMLLVRIAYAAQLPTPAEAIRSTSPAAAGLDKPVHTASPAAPENKAINTPPASMSASQSAKAAESMPQDFAEVVALFEKHREMLLAMQLKQDARLVSFAPGRIELRLTSQLPRDFTTKLADFLGQWTQTTWKITLSDAEGNPSLHETETAHKHKRMEEASQHPLVASVMEQFPGAKLVSVDAG